MRILVDRAMSDVDRGLGGEGLTLDEDAAAHLVEHADGDARHVLTALEVSAALAAEGGCAVITLADAEAALSLRALRYGDDDHYDVLSAFIKSIRGSDPDAGLYWLARMLAAGEDPRLVARRLVILASEDIGLADPQALLVADAAARAVEYVGLPEAQLNLAQAVLHLSLAPKSNSVVAALGAAADDVRERPAGRVPGHLRDAHYPGARQLGHGEGYVYPHDEPGGWTAQEYRPPEVAGRRYFRPSGRGADVDESPAYRDPEVHTREGGQEQR
jgi:putative ATPase